MRHSRWPLALLLVSSGLAAVAVIDALAAVRSQQRVASRALGDYANFAAWSYRQHLREAMAAAAQEALGPVYHGAVRHVNPQIPDVSDLVRYLPYDQACLCHRLRSGPDPIAFFGFNIAADTVAVAPYNQATGDYLRADRAWLTDTIRRQVHSEYQSDWGFTYIIARHDGQARDFSYVLMPTVWGDTIVYGAEYRPETLAAFVGGVLDASDLLPSTFTRRHANRELLHAQIRDASDAVLFASEPGTRPAIAAAARMPASYGGIAVWAGIKPEIASQLVIGGLPRSHLPLLLSLITVAAALAVVAVAQIRREGELGQLRADFVANVSHELRTPLAQMRLDLDTIRLGRYASDAQRLAAFDRVDREARRLAFLAENVLRFSRRGRTEAGSARHATDVAAETVRIVDEFRPLAAGRRATIATDIAAQPIAMLDRDALRQLVLNLLDNAVKYGPPSQTIRVGVSNGATIRVSVSDEGPGVPAAERELIWQPFRRGAGAVRHGVGGSGMGLTIVREIAEQHGGRALVEGGQSGGAIFIVELPAVG